MFSMRCGNGLAVDKLSEALESRAMYVCVDASVCFHMLSLMNNRKFKSLAGHFLLGRRQAAPSQFFKNCVFVCIYRRPGQDTVCSDLCVYVCITHGNLL